jgi:hypothetical protein
MSNAERPSVKNGDRIDAGDIGEALMRAPFTFTDGATQVFTRDGRTTYIGNASSTSGTWGVNDQGQFWSFWPPSYRATYDVFWITDTEGNVVGIRFSELNSGATFEGRYVSKLT